MSIHHTTGVSPGSTIFEESDDTHTSGLLKLSQEDATIYGKILELLAGEYHVNFRHYRQHTVLRRLTRRISLTGQPDYAEYLNFLTGHPFELAHLYDDLLLSYTRFFREPEVFDFLKQSVFPQITRNRSGNSPVRIWVPGCSTGEEAYSLAMVFAEFREENDIECSMQLFGTDLVERHISKARNGMYPETIADSVDQERIDRFFELRPDGYKVAKHLRETCIFAVHDLLRDPPYINMDLISFRNVLIYFDDTLKEKTLPLLHFGLSPNGFLLLGSSETIPAFSDYFEQYDDTTRFFTKKELVGRSSYHFPSFTFHPQQVVPAGISRRRGVRRTGKTGSLTQQVDVFLAEHYAPPAVILDSECTVRHMRGNVAKYLAVSSGVARPDFTSLAREGLAPGILLAVDEVKNGAGKRRERDIGYTTEGGEVATVDVEIMPIIANDTNEQLFLIMFLEPSASSRNVHSIAVSEKEESVDSGNTSALLRQKLNEANENLKNTIGEKDRISQELWATNEEIQASNEELLGLNEELEAAKKALEAGNQELVSINDELTAKNIDLEKAEERFRTIINQAGDAVFISDAEGRIVETNVRAAKSTGYSRGELLEKTIMELDTNCSTIAAYRAEWDKTTDNEIRPIKSFHVRKDGSSFPVEISVSKISISEQPYLLEFVTDISDRIAAMDSRLQLERQTYRTQKLESLGVLAGGIAHDFNNLLGGIFGYMDLSLCTNDCAEKDELVKESLKSIDRARSLTNQLLTFSKGGEPVRQIRQLFPFVKSLVGFSLSGSNVSVEFNIQDDLHPCNFDENQLGQVIDNIVINAKQAMPEGGHLTVTARNRTVSEGSALNARAGEYVEINFADTGPGIPEENLLSIFDPFYTTKQLGSGLGLSTSYSIIKRHDGWIDVKSSAGKGAEFSLYLPAAEATVQVQKPFESTESHSGRGTILIMDDEPVIRETVGSMLKSFGYTVVYSENGDEALHHLESMIDTPAAVIFDLTIPGGKGGKEIIDATRRIIPHGVILVISGYAEDPIMAAPVSYGFTASLRKPFSRNELAKVFNRIMK